MVDTNKDGKMSLTDPAIHDSQPTKERPYKFWCNDDHDSAEQDHPGSTTKDSDSNMIVSQRDLEDFARLHINLGNRIGTGYALAINDHKTSGVDEDGNPTQTPSPQILGYLGSEPTLWETSPDYNGFVPNALSEMIPNNDAWHLTSVTHQNDLGAIVGFGGYLDPSEPHATREGHGFLLLPVEIVPDYNRNGMIDDEDREDKEQAICPSCQLLNLSDHIPL
jgi:hypothetical protein